jgi:hypothetical protein
MKTFIIHMDGPIENVFYSEDPKVMELYVREKDADKISYGQPSNEKINFAQIGNVLKLGLRLPMEYIPDPRTVIEDAQDREKEERDAEERRKRIEEERMIKEAQKMARQEEKRK